MKNGLIGKKLGMTQVFDEKGNCIPVTVILAGPCSVVRIKTEEVDGYKAYVLGFNEVDSKKAERVLGKPEAGVFKKAGVKPTKVLKEFSFDNEYKVGDVITANFFTKGDAVDVQGTTRGRGFTGTIQRWNFSRIAMSHGAGPVHRHSGSKGANSTPSRVMPGKPMAGQYGGETQTILNLEVVGVDEAKNVLLIKGGIPGPKNSLVYVRKAVKAQKK
jgi:large subunit ribosomal protein L3